MFVVISVFCIIPVCSYVSMTGVISFRGDDVRCGLSELDADPKPYEFKIIGDDVKDDIEADGSAKVYFDLVKGKKTLMNMELRYKGGFTSQPQFFGTLAKYFK